MGETDAILILILGIWLMFSDKFYFRYPVIWCWQREWERESLQHSSILAVPFIELLCMILFEETIVLGERKRGGGRRRGRERERERAGQCPDDLNHLLQY